MNPPAFERLRCCDAATRPARCLRVAERLLTRAVLVLLGLATALCASTPRAAEPAGTAVTAPQYRAPSQNTAPRRVGGSSRGIPPALPAVAALVPDHLGLTLSEQPTLYWYLSAPTDVRIEITLIQPGLEAPLLELSVAGTHAGIHALDLRRHGLRLAAGIEYEWFVAVVADGQQRSRDIVAGGAIMRIDRAEPAAPDAATYAGQGLWYDALMALDRSAREQPTDLAPHGRRAALLEQAGLGEVAAFERR